MTEKDKLTPLFKQYNDIKSQYPDVILMFRLGDFYEMFGEDAENASRELHLTLTGRDSGSDRIPMCGVPHHAHERYVAQLVRKGYRVAICDQVEDPKTAKGLVKRQVTRVVSAGTVLDDRMLDASSNNYLAAVTPAEKAYGLAVLDVTTAEFLCTEIGGEDPRSALLDELQRLRPSEILLRPDCDEMLRTTLTEQLQARAEPYTRKNSNPPYADLVRHFGTQSLRGFGCENLPLAVEAAAMCLDYVRANLPDLASHIRSLAAYSTSQWMLLDAAARRNLELVEGAGDSGRDGSLLAILDSTVTPMGARMLRKWLSGPMLNASKINNRLDAVQEMLENALFRSALRDSMKGISDLERLMGRITGGQASPRDLVALRDSLGRLPDLMTLLQDGTSPHLKALAARMDPLPELYELLLRALRDEVPQGAREGGIIRPGHSDELDNLLGAASGGREWIASLEDSERERTGIRSLKVGYNSVFGYFIEVTKPNLHLVPQDYIRKQTTANAERYITPSLKEYEALVLGADDKSTQLEYELFIALRTGAAEHAGSIRQTARAVAQLDVLTAFAEVAARNRYVRPQVDEGDEIIIRGGRHPVVERTLQGEQFVPNDAYAGGGDDRLLVITGPNMSGKCLSGDTLLFTDRGVIPLLDLMPNHSPAGEFAPIDFQVQGPQGLCQASHFYNGGRQPTIRLTTRLGYQIEGTAEHRVWVRHPDGIEGWALLGSISEGDVVAIQRGADLWGKETAIDTLAVQSLPRSRQYQLPLEMDADLAYLMGLLIGDGTLTYTHSFLLSTADDFIADEFCRINRRLFGCQPGRKKNGKDYFVTSQQLRAFLLSLGLGYAQAHEKRVPICILRAPRPIVSAFLQGLFDTDGFVEKRYGNVQLSTASPQMAREVQLLLLNMGILASVRVKQTPCKPAYEVSVYGPEAITFHREVGFRLPRKQVRSELCSALRMPNIGGIPYLRDELKQVQARIVATADKPVALKHNKSINSIFYTYIPSGRNISYRKLDELIAYCRQSDVACPELEKLQSKRYFYDPVTRIETDEKEVYDLSVADEHAYVANGFVSHNSTYLRQVGLIVLMAQCGCYVPADSARIGIVDRIFTRVGAHDDLASGQSTFMVEMNETACILNNATSRSLVILDEIGRGTSTFDGLSIAWAVCEYLLEIDGVGVKTLFATHYHHLNELEKMHGGVRNYRVAVKEEADRVVWLRKIVRGGTDKSYGIQVARMAGLPPEALRRAEEVLAELERSEVNVTGLDPRKAQISATTEKVQLSLFEAAAHPAIEELLRLDTSVMTPVEALTTLDRLQRAAREGGR